MKSLFFSWKKTDGETRDEDHRRRKKKKSRSAVERLVGPGLGVVEADGDLGGEVLGGRGGQAGLEPELVGDVVVLRQGAVGVKVAAKVKGENISGSVRK